MTNNILSLAEKKASFEAYRENLKSMYAVHYYDFSSFLKMRFLPLLNNLRANRIDDWATDEFFEKLIPEIMEYKPEKTHNQAYWFHPNDPKEWLKIISKIEHSNNFLIK